MSSDYEHLMLMQKVEVFEQAIESTSGDDLAKVLWLKSPSSEVSHSSIYSAVAMSGLCRVSTKSFTNLVSV